MGICRWEITQSIGIAIGRAHNTGTAMIGTVSSPPRRRKKPWQYSGPLHDPTTTTTTVTTIRVGGGWIYRAYCQFRWTLRDWRRHTSYRERYRLSTTIGRGTWILTI